MSSVTALHVVPSHSFREILQFNFLPTQYMDDSWWQNDWLQGISLDCKKFPTQAQFYLSRFFLRQINLSGQFDFDFIAPEKLIALLPAQLLKRLVYLTGLTLQSQRIAQVILGSVRRTIKDFIGEADYFFALKRGVLLLKEVQFQTMIPAENNSNFDTVKEDCFLLGVTSLATVMDSFSMAFVRRLQLKLPKTLVENHWKASVSDKDAHLRLLLRLAKKLV